MAKSAKKQQKRLQKKKKARSERNRQLRHSNRTEPLFPEDIPELRAGTDEQILRSRIQKFAFTNRFSDDFHNAYARFFGHKIGQRSALTFEGPEMANFQEWYFFDYELQNGKHIIDQFIQSVGPSLSPTQLQIAEDWVRTNYVRLLEVQEITPGSGEVVQDLLTGEVFECSDITFSNTASRWEIAVARPLFTVDQWNFTGAGVLAPPQHKERIVAFATLLRETYQEQHQTAKVADFYRSHGIEIQEFVTDLLKRASQPIPLTAEGHEVVTAKAIYRVLDFAKVDEQIEAAEEFVYAGDSHEHPNADHYNWLMRGRSSVPENTDTPEFSLLLRTEWTMGPGQPSFLSIGDLTIWPKGVELSCMSRERLRSGKALLEEILDGLIRHQRDRFEKLDLSREKPKTSPLKETQRFQDEAPLVTQELMEREMESWLDTPRPNLNDLSPRAAALTDEGRAALTELLKIMEYHNAKSQSDLGPFTADGIRRELGL